MFPWRCCSVILASFNNNCTIDRHKSTKKIYKKLPRQIFNCRTKKKERNQEQDTKKKRSPKKLKKKQDSQKDKKGWFLQKHRIEEPRNESLTITIKYKYD